MLIRATWLGWWCGWTLRSVAKMCGWESSESNVFYATAAGRISVDEMVIPLIRNVKRHDRGTGDGLIGPYSAVSDQFDRP